MKDIIYRQAAIDAIKELCENYTRTTSTKHPHINFVIEELEELPSAQPDMSEYSDKLWRNAYERGKKEGQRTGRWIWEKEGYHCSECHTYESTTNILVWDFKFCPNCGARMEVEE